MPERIEARLQINYVLDPEERFGTAPPEGRGVPFIFGSVQEGVRRIAPWFPVNAFEVVINLRGGGAVISRKCTNPVLVILEGNERLGRTASKPYILVDRSPTVEDLQYKSVLSVDPDYIESFRVQVLETGSDGIHWRVREGERGLRGLNTMYLEFSFELNENRKWVFTTIERKSY